MAGPLTNRRVDHTALQSRREAHPAMLRAASGRSGTAAGLGGRFEAAAPRRKSDLGATFVTGLLVIYPAFAAMLAIIFGLFLTGRGA